MARFFALVKRYPLVAIALLVGAVGLVLLALGHEAIARWVVSGFAVLVALLQLRDMVRDLMSGSWGIDVLAIIAIAATVTVGEYWASLIIVVMLSGGEALEDYAEHRAKRELTSLLSNAPRVAHRLTSGSDADTAATKEVPVDEVVVGDRLLVRPGEVVPVDGVLETSDASFDEASLTGESLPVERGAGESVLSGAVNGPRAVVIRASAAAADSQYQRIVALVTEAAESKAPLVRLADRYAVPFTAVSLLIAGAAWLLSGDPVRFAEVLVVATPCPLLIAAPVAFMGGMSRAARRGIIVKGGGTLEQLSRTRTVAFDKTGTLSVGAPTVVAIRPAAGVDEDELLRLVASAEQYSSHVLAASIVETATQRGLRLASTDDAKEHATDGVAATIGARSVVVGKRAFVASHTGAVDEAVLASGELGVYVGVDGEFAGVVILSDPLRSNAAETLTRLRGLGIEHTLILTGDARSTAQHVAAEAGITDVHAELLPQDKVEIVRSLSHRPVAMVGDGVNDAPVLAVADVGIAMGARGATAASDSADVVILVDDISKTADALYIGQRTTRIALESIWVGIAISVGLMLVAAFGYLPAVVGAAMQEIVDLVTIVAALRALGSRSETAKRPTGREITASRQPVTG